MKIVPLASHDIEQAVLLHTQCLPHTRSSRIGLSYLNYLYTTLYNHPDLHILLGAKDEKNLAGVITITLDLKQTQKLISQSFFSQTPAILGAICSGRVSLWEIARQIHVEKQLASRFSDPFTEILTVFVDPLYRKTGVGTKLVLNAEMILRKKHISLLYVDTQITNTGARAFYEKIGFVEEAIIMDCVVLSKIWKKK